MRTFTAKINTENGKQTAKVYAHSIADAMERIAYMVGVSPLQVSGLRTCKD